MGPQLDPSKAALVLTAAAPEDERDRLLGGRGHSPATRPTGWARRISRSFRAPDGPTAGDYRHATLGGTGQCKDGAICAQKIIIKGGQYNISGGLVAGRPADWSVDLPANTFVMMRVGFFDIPVSFARTASLYLAGLAPAIVSLPLGDRSGGDQAIQAVYDAAQNHIFVERVAASSPGGGIRIDAGS